MLLFYLYSREPTLAFIDKYIYEACGFPRLPRMGPKFKALLNFRPLNRKPAMSGPTPPSLSPREYSRTSSCLATNTPCTNFPRQCRPGHPSENTRMNGRHIPASSQLQTASIGTTSFTYSRLQAFGSNTPTSCQESLGPAPPLWLINVFMISSFPSPEMLVSSNGALHFRPLISSLVYSPKHRSLP